VSDTGKKSRNPWSWVPTLYLAEGFPNALVASVSIVLYKNMGISNKDIALYTAWLYLPWVIKPLWSPVVDLLKTRRQWIWVMQFFIGALLAGVALTIPAPHFFRWTLAFFWLVAFSSATQDIAADGFYMLATSEQEQSYFSGIRSAFYRIATILAQGQLVILAGIIHAHTGSYASAWTMIFAMVAGLFLCFGIYHRLALPRPDVDRPKEVGAGGGFVTEFLKTFGSFFLKPRIGVLLAFILFYRLGEAQLVKMVQPFLLDPRAQGGLGLSNDQLGLVYGTAGFIIFIFGALLGGFVVARNGLKSWLWPMLLAIHLPDAVFIWLAYAQPTSLWVIGAGVAVEQFGYGFGFTAFMLYLIYIARGEHRTAHYAICTGFMALGMMLPGMWSGWLQERIGYQHFFIWVILATIPSFIVAARIPLDADFGKRNVAN